MLNYNEEEGFIAKQHHFTFPLAWIAMKQAESNLGQKQWLRGNLERRSQLFHL